MNGAASGDDGGATAAADLVLLHQNLAKSKRVTTRMTALLTSFDDRLARLDKSVVPIHRSTKDLSKIQRNVESALLAIDAVLGTNDLLDREEEVLMRDPREDLASYQASLTRLKSAMESMERSSSVGQANGLDGLASMNGKGKEREGTLGRVRSLIDLGCNNLGTLFYEYTESASPKSGWTDIAQWDAGQGVPIPTLMPQGTIASLVGLLGFLRTILGQDSRLEKELQKGYGDRRGMFIATTLNQVGREVADGVEVHTRSAGFAMGRLQAVGMRGFGRFLDTMFALLKSEHALAGAVFEKYQANRIYSFIVPPALTIFSGVGAQMNTAIKKTLTSNPTSVGIAFTCYIELTLPHRTETFEDWIKNKAGRSGRQENELAQLSHAFKASCLRCLPEYIEEARQYGAKNNLTQQELVNVNVAPVNINTVSFVKQLTEYPDTVDGLLATLGDGKWMPSGKVANTSNNRGYTDEGYGLLSKYLGDILETLLTSIDARGRSIGFVKGVSHGPSSVLKKDANASSSGGGASHAARQASGLAAIYALNNVSYLRREVLLNSSIPDYLASGAASRRASSSTTATGGGMGGHSTSGLDIEDEMNRRNRSSRSAYLEIFSPLVSCLMDAGMEQSMLKSAIGVGNTEKKDTKDRFARFNDALEEVENIHKLGKVDRSPENADFRARLKDEVVRMCVPTYTAFVRKHDNFSKNPSKYLKHDPQGLQSRLESLFE